MKRYASVVGLGISPEKVSAYLPANYAVASDEPGGDPFGDENEAEVIIEGEDVAGWTLDDYVIPRLASGLFVAREQFLHIEDVGDAENGPRISTWLEDRPMGTDPNWRRA